jgi:hypothetical protein
MSGEASLNVMYWQSSKNYFEIILKCLNGLFFFFDVLDKLKQTVWNET